MCVESVYKCFHKQTMIH